MAGISGTRLAFDSHCGGFPRWCWGCADAHGFRPMRICCQTTFASAALLSGDYAWRCHQDVRRQVMTESQRTWVLELNMEGWE